MAKDFEIFCADHGARSADGTRRGTLQQKIKKLDRPKNWLTKEKSEETMEATSPRCYALLPLGAVAYVGAVQIALEVSFRSHQTGLRLLIPDALSRPIIFQRLPGLVPQARLEFCHSGPRRG